MNEPVELTQLNPYEKKRTYIFPNGRVEFENIKAIQVRKSGGHRLELESGEKVIVNSGWLAIVLVVDAWTL